MAIAFTEPSSERKQHLISQMYQVSDLDDSVQEEFTDTIKKIRDELDSRIRSKTTAIQDTRDHGQHHYFAIRALNDPKDPTNQFGNSQLVGEEFFGLNRFVDELLDVADVQWWAMYDGKGWDTHRRCDLGEHLECWGSSGKLKAAVIFVNGMPLNLDETLSFYRTFINRRRKKFTERFKRETVDDILKRGKNITLDELELLEELGLAEYTELTYTGRSLVEKQEASDRKNASHGLQAALDHHGLAKDQQLGPHGKLFEIVNYLQTNGIKALLEKPVITENEFSLLKDQEALFVKRFGFSYLHESSLRLWNLEDVSNPIIRVMAEEVLPFASKPRNLDDVVIKEFKERHKKDFQSRVNQLIDASLAICPYKSIEECVKTALELKRYGLSEMKIEQSISIALNGRAKIAMKSRQLEEKFGLIAILHDFLDYVSFFDMQLKKVGIDMFDLFKQEYSGTDYLGKFNTFVEFATNLAKIQHLTKGAPKLEESISFMFGKIDSAMSLWQTVQIIEESATKVVWASPVSSTEVGKAIQNGMYLDKFKKAYFDKVFKGKSSTERLQICQEYSNFLLINQSLMPADIKKASDSVGGLNCLLAVAPLVDGHLDEFLAEFCEFKQNVQFSVSGSDKLSYISQKNTFNDIYNLKNVKSDSLSPTKVYFLDLLAPLDDQVLDQLKQIFILSGYEVTMQGSRLKIANFSTSISGMPDEFCQTALYLSYLNAKQQNPNLTYDPKKQHLHEVDVAKISFRFGDAVPEQAREVNEYTVGLTPIIKQEQQRREEIKDKGKYYSGLERIFEKYESKNNNSLENYILGGKY